MPEFESARISVPNAAIRGNEFEFLVVTNSMKAPIVTLADNTGYPHVRDFYARESDKHHNRIGVHVHIRFEGPLDGEHGFAINVAQPGMTPGPENDYLVIPLV